VRVLRGPRRFALWFLLILAVRQAGATGNRWAEQVV